MPEFSVALKRVLASKAGYLAFYQWARERNVERWAAKNTGTNEQGMATMLPTPDMSETSPLSTESQKVVVILRQRAAF